MGHNKGGTLFDLCSLLVISLLSIYQSNRLRFLCSTDTKSDTSFYLLQPEVEDRESRTEPQNLLSHRESVYDRTTS